jgi:hypothetical protein
MIQINPLGYRYTNSCHILEAGMDFFKILIHIAMPIFQSWQGRFDAETHALLRGQSRYQPADLNY